MKASGIAPIKLDWAESFAYYLSGLFLYPEQSHWVTYDWAKNLKVYVAGNVLTTS